MRKEKNTPCDIFISLEIMFQKENFILSFPVHCFQEIEKAILESKFSIQEKSWLKTL